MAPATGPSLAEPSTIEPPTAPSDTMPENLTRTEKVVGRPEKSKSRKRPPTKKEREQRKRNGPFEERVLADGVVCRVAQLKDAPFRLDNLLKYLDTLARKPDVIMVQDPPIGFAFQTLPGYDRWFATMGNVKLTDEDAPGYRWYNPPKMSRAEAARRAAKATQPKKRLIKVAFMVHQTVPGWRVQRWDDAHTNIFATLHVPTDDRTVMFHNMLNHPTAGKLDVELLAHAITPGPDRYNIFAADLNMTHLDWDPQGRGTPGGALVKEFVAFMRESEMVLLNNPGEITYSLAVEGVRDDHESVPDVIYADAALTNLKLVDYEIPDVVAFRSDHRIRSLFIHSVLVERFSKLVYYWDLVDPSEFEERVVERLKTLERPFVYPPTKIVTDSNGKEEEIVCIVLADLAEARSMLGKIVDVLQSVIAEKVPTGQLGGLPTNPQARRNAKSSQVQEQASAPAAQEQPANVQVAGRPQSSTSRDSHIEPVDPVYDELYDSIYERNMQKSHEELGKEVKDLVEKIPPEKINRAKELSHIQAHERRKPLSIHTLHKIVTRKYKVKLSRGMPDVVHDGKTLHLDAEKAPAYLSTVFGGHIRLRSELEFQLLESRDPLLEPCRTEDRIQYPIDRELRKGELLKVLKRAPKGKAPGIGDVPFEALKMCDTVIAPYLEVIYNMYLEHELGPERFKDTITCCILKDGKPPDQLKSYRPIAVTMPIAKSFERIVADRIVELAIAHDLLPQVQFGKSGGSTTQALEYIFNFVHRSWIQGKLVTIASLDLTGAFDHVDRKILIQILVNKGMPDWIVNFIWSWLSYRRTFVRLPGKLKSEEAEYMVDTGIPQGSPLSSVLFCFYAAALLDKDHRAGYSPNTLCLSGYADDIQIVIAADTRDRNLHVFQDVHNKLCSTAEERNLHFSPSKYGFLHLVDPKGKQANQDYCQQLPNLPVFQNLTPARVNELCPPYLRILGVDVDRYLNFEYHFLNLQKRVRLELAISQRYTTTISGRTLEDNLKLYEEKILPKIKYAAGAWFISLCPSRKETLRFGLGSKTFERLRSLQTECLSRLCGARPSTDRFALLFVNNVPDIVYQLYAAAMSHRCQSIPSIHYHTMCDARFGNIGSHEYKAMKEMNEHPQQLLTNAAEDVMTSKPSEPCELETWARTHTKLLRSQAYTDVMNVHPSNVTKWKQRKLLIKAFWSHKAFVLTKRDFEQKVIDRKIEGKHPHLVYRCQFEDGLRASCAKLSRAQSTMAVYIWTGNIPLAMNVRWSAPQGIESTKCPLCAGLHNHTAEHLFFHCPTLEKPREWLMKATHGERDFKRLMTDHIIAATSWAIQFFMIELFRGVKLKPEHEFPRL